MYIFYKKNDTLTFVSRAPDSTIWNEEKSVNVPNCPSIKETQSISTSSLSSTNETYMIYYLICKNEQKFIPVIGESKDNGMTWNTYTKNISVSSTLLSTSLTRLAYRDKIYGGIAEKEGEARWPRITAFEYMLHGKWNTVASFPATDGSILNIQLCSIKGNMNLFYLSSESSMWLLTSVLKQIPLAEHYNEVSLPKLQFGACSYVAQIVCGDDKLLGTGAGNCDATTLYGKRYIFPDSEMAS